MLTNLRKSLRFIKECNINRKFSYKVVKRPDEKSITAVKTKQKEILELPEKTYISDIAKNLHSKILATGPLTVAEYMREALTHPYGGYYMHRDVFGQEGDFITSPDISQIFGELVAVWILNEWSKIGDMDIQLVELGPGRGTLAYDILRIFGQFRMDHKISLHFVEVSPHLSKLQAQRLCYKHRIVDDENLPFYQMGETSSGVTIYWYKNFEDVPKNFSIVIAHEFFDALPIHKLQFDDGVWKEILIDVNDLKEESLTQEYSFRYVISPGQTPISKIYKSMESDERKCLEYSIETERLLGLLCERIEKNGGFALIVDYGHYGEKSDTFRAFRQHTLHDPLMAVGTADLTADVDFRRMQHNVQKNYRCICFGPVEQGSFLNKMQGQLRLERLLRTAPSELQEKLKSGYEMLTHPDKMGSRYKFFSIFPAILDGHLEKYPVMGF